MLSPWAVRNVRFDESLGTLHGYDIDFCLQVREAGRKVVTADFRAIHNHTLEPFSDPEAWIEAHMRIAEKWDGRMPDVGSAAGTWKGAGAAAPRPSAPAARVLEHSDALVKGAQIRELERALAETTGQHLLAHHGAAAPLAAAGAAR